MEISSTEELRNIIVIGASAGGIQAIREVIAQISADRNVAVFVVLHVSRKSNSEALTRIFQKITSLTCEVGTDGAAIRRGHLYLAPPNHHMMVNNGRIRVHQGTRENKYRPSIDVLFRSAAVNYRSRVIGIILSGMFDDGTSGMSAIKRCGGICIIQDPSDAEFPDMPKSVINHLQVDYQVPLANVGNVLEDIFNKPVPPDHPVPKELQVEATITEKMMTSINELKEFADRSDFVCPDCGGGLWAIKNDPMHRYRCHTGHVYYENTLFEIQGLHLEESVWISIRMLEERRNLLLLMGTHAQESENVELAQENKKRAQEMDLHIKRLKFILAKLTEDMSPTDMSSVL